jgi:hypothetical protein
MKTIISFKVSSIKTFSDQAPNIICIWAASCKKAKYYKARAKPVFKFTPKKSMVKNICLIKWRKGTFLKIFKVKWSMCHCQKAWTTIIK